MKPNIRRFYTSNRTQTYYTPENSFRKTIVNIGTDDSKLNKLK